MVFYRFKHFCRGSVWAAFRRVPCRSVVPILLYGKRKNRSRPVFSLGSPFLGAERILKRHKLCLSLPQRQRSGASTRKRYAIMYSTPVRGGQNGRYGIPRVLDFCGAASTMPAPACALRRLRQRTQINLLHSMSEAIDHPGHVALHGGALCSAGTAPKTTTMSALNGLRQTLPRGKKHKRYPCPEIAVSTRVQMRSRHLRHGTHLRAF